MVLQELVEIIKFEVDDKSLKKFDAGLKSATKALAGIAVVVAAAGAAVYAFVSDVAGSTDEMGKQAEQLGISVEAYQELTHAAELNGASQQSLTSSLVGVSKAASEAARGAGGGVEAFGMLGVSVTDANGNIKDSDALLLDVADSLENVGSQAQKMELLSKLGISEDMLLTLDQGSDAMRRQMQEAKDLGFVLSKNATKDAAKFADEQLRVTKVIKGVSNQIAIGLMPGITKLMTVFKKWFIANKALIKQNLQSFLQGITKAVTFFYNIAVRVISVIDTIATSLGGWKNLIMLAAGAWAVLNANMLLVPLLAIAIAAGIFLLVEDIIAFANGGDSAIQSLIDKFPMLEAPIRFIIDILASVAEGWRLIFTEGDKALEGLGILIDRWIIQPFNKVLGLIDGVTESMSSIADIKIPSLGDIGSSISNFVGLGKSPALTPSAATAGGNNSSSQSISANITVNANGASGTDAKVIAQNVREEILKIQSDQNKTAIRNLKGVVAQ